MSSRPPWEQDEPIKLGQCSCGKWQFISRRAAKRARKKVHRGAKDMRAYRCRICRYWHYGHAKGPWYELAVASLAVDCPACGSASGAWCRDRQTGERLPWNYTCFARHQALRDAQAAAARQQEAAR